MAKLALPKRSRVLLALFAVLAFGNVVRGSFHFDDYSIFSSGAQLAQVFRPETTRPLTFAFLWLFRMAFGQNPLPFHIASLLLHVACVWLLFECVNSFLADRAAFLAAALFAIHPIQTEAVAYVFAVSTLLMTLFCLVSWRSWIAGHYWRSVFWFACALLAKEECVFFCVFLFLLDRSQPRATAAMCALSFAAGLRVVAATSLVKNSGAGFTAGISVAHYAVAQGGVIWRYIRQIGIPAGFSVDPEIHIPVLAGCAGWIGIAAVIYVFRRQRETLFFAGGVVLLLASSSIFPASDLAADRRIYLPFVSFSVCLALLASRAPRRVLPWLLVACGAIFIPLSTARSEVWRTEPSLWSDAAAKAPTKVRPRLQLARALSAEQGLALLNATERDHPDNPDLPAERGRIYLQSKQPGFAVTAFGRAAALSPRNAQAWSNLAVAFAMLGQPDAARQNFQRALRIDPCLADARRNLGLQPCAP